MTAALLLTCAARASWQPPGAAAADAPGPELAGGWSQAPERTAAREGRPRLLAAGRDGGRIVVWATDPVYEGAGDVTVDVQPGGGAARRSVVRRSQVVDWARTTAGDVDLLLEQGASRGRERPGRLVLYRVRRTGGVRRVWSGGSAGYRGAAIARSGERVAVAWLGRVASRHSPFGRPVLRLATSADGRRFGPPRTLRGVLPSWLAMADIGFVSSIGLALGPGGSLVVA